MSKLTQDEIKSLFDYKNGKLVWKIKPNRNIRVGAYMPTSTQQIRTSLSLMVRITGKTQLSACPFMADVHTSNTLHGKEKLSALKWGEITRIIEMTISTITQLRMMLGKCLVMLRNCFWFYLT